ncbi:MAG: hypothetical protein AAB395_02690 [Patescibacteria group bacterium]
MPEKVYILALAVIVFAFAFVVIAGPKVKGENILMLLVFATAAAGLINLYYIPSSLMNNPGMQGFFAILVFYLSVAVAGFSIGKFWRAHFVSTKKVGD